MSRNKLEGHYARKKNGKYSRMARTANKHMRGHYATLYSSEQPKIIKEIKLISVGQIGDNEFSLMYSYTT